MSNLLSQDQAALKMLFTEDLYLIGDGNVEIPLTIQPRVIAQAPAEKIEPAANPISETSSKAATAPTEFEYLGENNKYFLVLIDEKIHTRINPAHQEMLLKIMNAKKLELRDLAILNINRYPQAKFADLKAFFSCNRVALFGVAPARLGLPPVPLNKAENTGDLKVLATYSLEEMRTSDDKKREFWNVMKNF